jgi:hypothetical protein
MSMTTITKICTPPVHKNSLDLELSRGSHIAREIEAKSHTKDTIKYIPNELKYEDTACAKMEAARRPRAVARMKKLKN